MKLTSLIGTKSEIILAEKIRESLINKLDKKIKTSKDSDYKYILTLERDYLAEDVKESREFINIYKDNTLQRERSL